MPTTSPTPTQSSAQQRKQYHAQARVGRLGQLLLNDKIYKHVAFVGTRQGLAELQRDSLATLLSSVHYGTLHIHHGGSLGADTELHHMAHTKGHLCIVHPANNAVLGIRILAGTFRPVCEHCKFLPPAGSASRDRRMIQASEVLIACPYEFNATLNSRVWAAIRYARMVRYSKGGAGEGVAAKRIDMKIVIVLPDGTYTEEKV